MGYIDPDSGTYIYTGDEPLAGVPIQDVLNRAQNAERNAQLQDRARITSLEAQVGGGYGVARLSADQTVAPATATVNFNQTVLSAGVTRSGSALVPQSDGVYIVSFNFSATPSNANTWRNVFCERWQSGAWVEIPLMHAQCAMGPNGTAQYASLSMPVALAADGSGVRMRTGGSTGAPSVVINALNTFLSLVKVSA